MRGYRAHLLCVLTLGMLLAGCAKMERTAPESAEAPAPPADTAAAPAADAPAAPAADEAPAPPADTPAAPAADAPPPPPPSETSAPHHDAGLPSTLPLPADATARPISPGTSSPDVSAKVGDSKPYALVRVFYATDRSPVPESGRVKTFGSKRGTLSFGTCDVSIPRDHKVGELEAPSLLKFWRMDFHEDPSKHVMITSLDPLSKEAYFDGLRKRVNQSHDGNALVFVHGYNVTFEDAARRTAQMAWDLSFDGPAILYSWPSMGAVTGYPVDANNVRWSTPHLKQFLADVATQSQAQNIYLLAHSMGTQALVDAFNELVAENPAARAKFREVILAAPDIDADLFKNSIAPQLAGSGSSTTHVTLYASSRDRALLASKKWGAYSRAGDAGNAFLIAPGIETIDASLVDSGVLGHSYFADNRLVVSDLFYLISQHIRACSRFSLVTDQGRCRFKN